LLQQNYAAAGKKQTCSSDQETPIRKRNAARAHIDAGGTMRAIFWSWQISLAEPCKATHRLGHADARRSGSVAEKPRTVKRRFLFPIGPASEWTNWRISRV
jgi:hypothetical protein